MPINQNFLDRIQANKFTNPDLSLNHGKLNDNDILQLAKALAVNQYIKKLNLNSNYITAFGAKALTQCTNITHLSLNDNVISDEGLTYLATLPLIELQLNNNRITDAGAESLINHPTLRKLIISNNAITTKGAMAISTLPHLEILQINSNIIYGEGAKALAKLHLIELDIGDNVLTNPCIEYFIHHPTLMALSVQNNPLLNDIGLVPLVKNSLLTLLDTSKTDISYPIYEELEKMRLANVQRRIYRRNFFIKNLIDGLHFFINQVDMPNEIIKIILSYLNAEIYLALMNIKHPAHIDKTAEQVSNCVNFIAANIEHMNNQSIIVENKATNRFRFFNEASPKKVTSIENGNSFCCIA